MSRLLSRLLVAAWAFAALAAAACERNSARGSTLPSLEPGANPSGELVDVVPLGRDVRRETLAEHVRGLARDLAGDVYRAPAPAPDVLAALDYDAYRSIRHRDGTALWKDEARFAVYPTHPGFLFSKGVPVHIVDGDGTTRLRFSPDDFAYGEGASHVAAELGAAEVASIGHAGFRVLYPLNTAGKMDEVAVFQGASYFRLVGAGQVFGLSARGLAIDIATNGPEEFPDFRAFWLVRPGPEDTTLVFHALLDGPSITGAYRFELAPGTAATSLAVDARVFARRDVKKLGVAPMSSMFLQGGAGPARFDDVRPEVHDSDGLLMWTGRGEWIWRPLSNRRGLHVTSLRDVDPRGFGLVQRQRDFEHYLDLEAEYHRRPSLWVAAQEGDWGSGGVELLEIPTDSEFNDNIAAYWVSDAPMAAGEERRYRYRLETFGGRLRAQTLGQVARTRVGWDALPGEVDPPPRSQRRVVVDFVGGPLAALADASVEPVLEVSAGRISDLRTQRIPSEAGWRASFRLEPEGDRPADMRLTLVHADEPVTETWSYVWYPEEVR